MILQCSLSQNSGFSWQKIRCASGELRYKGNEWETGKALALWAADEGADIDALKSLLAGLSYHYAVVFQGEGVLFAAVDQLRTHPLFYYATDDALYLTDDPYKLDQIELQQDNIPGVAEFQLSGYVAGGDTLDRNLKSLPARHCLLAAADKERTSLSIAEHLPRICGEALPVSGADTLNPMLRETGDQIFSEFCEGVHDRQVVLPLSSGYDSRYIAAMLKRHGHNDVVTYTYGEAGGWELDKSRETAERLGFPWHFIPYDRSFWRAQYNSQEMKAYLPFAARHSSTPHIQDWPAVRRLKEEKWIEEDSIFLPGHTCMLTSSNRLESGLFQQAPARWAELLSRSLYRNHFMLQRTRRVIDSEELLLRRIQQALPADMNDDPHALLNACFNFEAEERHGKLIINSARVYEFWGHQWAMPLWDKRLIDIWARVPYEGRYSKIAFQHFLEEENYFGLFPQMPEPGIYSVARERIKQTPLLFGPLKRIKCAENRLLGYFHEHFDWYGIISYPRYVCNMGRCGNVYSLLSRLYLEYLEANKTLVTGDSS